MAFSGVHTALITTFHADGSLDIERYEALCHRQIDAGIHGLVPCGTTGEAPTLTEDEWAQCIATAVRVSNGRVPVTAGAGTNDTRSTLARLERAKALGADAGLLVFPYYNKPNPHGLKEHVRQSASVGLPLVIYHVPGRTGQRLPAAQLAELANMEGVLAVKEATGDITFGLDVLSKTKTPILSGDDFTFLALQCMGGQGVVSVVSNVAPALTVSVYNDAASGDITAARQGLNALWDLIGFLFSDTNPVPCKAAMSEMGLCEPTVRLPLAPYAGPEATQILTRLGML
jgi:4-hydroxy-tetrahydrodipicolinate synthase